MSSATLRRNSSEASTKPATTPTTMSNTTVAVKQVISTSTSLRGAMCSTCTKWRTSLMRQATTSSRAAIAASGSWSSRGAPNTIASSRKPAWTTLAIGEVAPARTFVAVRAIAPVDAKPPNSGASRLPVPWASSSASGSCLWPHIASDATADSSDSIAPSSAITTALGISAFTVAHCRPSGAPFASGCCHGHANDGAPAGMPGTTTPSTRCVKRVPMVATVKSGHTLCRPWAARAVPPTATSGDGRRGQTRGNRSSRARVAKPIAVSFACSVGSAPIVCSTVSWKCCVVATPRSPSRSLTCPTAITTAMPAVKPVTTGYGRNWIIRPSRASPSRNRIAPAIIVASINPPGPCCWTIGTRTTTNAAVGPLTWTREPPTTAVTAPATIAV